MPAGRQGGRQVLAKTKRPARGVDGTRVPLALVRHQRIDQVQIDVLFLGFRGHQREQRNDGSNFGHGLIRGSTQCVNPSPTKRRGASQQRDPQHRKTPRDPQQAPHAADQKDHLLLIVSPC